MVTKTPSDVAADVFKELASREFTDIASCRVAWESERDPLALCVAILQADMPQWLSDALVIALLNEGEQRGALAEGWKKRSSAALQALRAGEVAGLASHPERPFKWESAFEAAAFLVTDRGAAEVSPAAMKKAYNDVRKNLPHRPGAYFRAPGFMDRLREIEQRIRESLENMSPDTPTK